MHQRDAGPLVSPLNGTTGRSIGPLASCDHEPRVVAVSIATLLPGEYPRSEGLDQEHVARLADVDGPLPPILVRRADMRVIDGTHRVLAALIRGHHTIDAEFFDGTPEEAFLRSVQANITHGLPLTQADRRAAATRIINSHPQMSDRAIARAAGLGTKAVAAIRRTSTDTTPLTVRIGRDGRSRPVNSAEGRQRAAQVIAENPQASLRHIARLAGISPATASDVRKRVHNGEPPTGKRSGPTEPPETPVPVPASAPERASSTPAPTKPRPRDPQRAARPMQADPAAALERVLRDPSLRLKQGGRQLLRLLQQNADAEWSGLTAAVPQHCTALVGSLARQNADAWLRFAQYLDEHNLSAPHRT